MYTPALLRVAGYVVGEDHVETTSLNTTERQRGLGLTYALAPNVSAQVDFRYINGRNGYLEHRWNPALVVHGRLPADIEVASRTRTELRDVRKAAGAVWSTKVEQRFTFSREQRLARLPITPFIAVQPSYDTRYATVNRMEELAGLRVPSGKVTTELFGEWWQDSRAETSRYASVGVLIRITG